MDGWVERRRSVSCIGGGREEGMHRIVCQEIVVCGVVLLKGKRKEKI